VSWASGFMLLASGFLPMGARPYNRGPITRARW
jgi:hypothetical protein